MSENDEPERFPGELVDHRRRQTSKRPVLLSQKDRIGLVLWVSKSGKNKWLAHVLKRFGIEEIPMTELEDPPNPT